MLEIKNLHVNIDGKSVLKGIDLSVKRGEIHALMGPNGAGKSTLARVLAGDPLYEVTEGEILLEGENLLSLEPQERAHHGLFMSFQYPIEIPGISNFRFLFSAYNALQKARNQPEIAEEQFHCLLDEKMERIGMKSSFKERPLNCGFSGGEKKRNEILQMALFSPKLSVLDETDSGLDIDALKAVAQGVRELHTADSSLLIITHYQRLLDYIRPHFVHIVVGGRITRSGGADLALELEESGYGAIG